MKVNYSIDIEPQETEAICNCITQIFRIYAKSEVACSMKPEIAKAVVEAVKTKTEEATIEEPPKGSPQVKVKPPKAAPAKKAAPAVKSERDFREEK